MSINAMRQAWPELRLAVDRFRHVSGPALEVGNVLSPAAFEGLAEPLAGALEMSEAIRREAEEVIGDARDRQYDEVAALLLAAATVDAMVASDLGLADPELREYRTEDFGAFDPAEAEAERRE